ncbi:hypothetical protein [Mycolicibacterium sp.]|uniref:hypothetical protein n=1 Tax=Mycolicibacterium sp. TaxID=2320850 RepID=UPI00355DD6C3
MSSFVYGFATRPRPMVQRRRRGAAVVGALAAAAGHVARVARKVAVNLPGVAGAGLISFGAWLAWAPAGFIVAGLFLLLLDRRAS